MKNIISLFLFFLMTQNILSQEKIDSLKYYYTLDLPAGERYSLIVKKVYSLYDNTSDAYKSILFKNLSLAKKTNDIEEISFSERTIGSYYSTINNDVDALNYYYKALKGFERTDNKKEISICYMSIGQVYKAMQDYKRSFEFIDKAVRLKEALNEKDYYYHGMLISHGVAALDIDDYTASYTSYKTSLDYFKDVPYFRIYIENNLGFFYNELFSESKVDSLKLVLKFSNKEQLLDSSYVYYNKTLQTANLLEDKKNIDKWQAYAYSGLGRNSYLRRNYAQAVKYLEITSSVSEKQTLTNDLLKISYKNLYLSYKAMGNYGKALTNYQKFIEFRDIIQSDENKRALFKQDLVYQHEKELRLKEDKIEAKNRLIIIFTISFVILLIILYLLIKRSRLIKEKKLQKQFSQNLLITQEEERKRISEDLHDGLGQSLLLVKNQLTMENYDKSKELLAGTIEEMRSIVKALYPFQLGRVGISIALENLVIQLDESYKDIDFFCEIEDVKGLLTINQETNIFRIVQESLSNIIKHAEADSAKVSLYLENSKVKIQIQDNGKGFDFVQKRNEFKTLGLRTIKERVDLLQGNLEINSEKNIGSSYVIRFPLAS